MVVLWFIIKVILYTILTLIGLILVLALGALVLPIAYEGRASYAESLTVKAKIKIFYVLTILLEQNEADLDFIIQLGRKTIFPRSSKRVKGKKRQDNKSQEKDMQQAKQIPCDTEKVQQLEDTRKPRSHKVIENKKEVYEKKEKSEKQKKEKKQEKQKKQIVKTIKESWRLAQTLWTDENRRSFLSAIRQLFRDLWRAIKPQYFTFELIVGRENPDETGHLLALLAFLFPFYCRYGSVVANFHESELSGKIALKGEFNLWRLSKPFLKLILNKSVRNYIYLILNIRKEEQNGNKVK